MLRDLIQTLCSSDLDGRIEVVHRISVHSWLPGWTVPFLATAVVALCVLQYRQKPGLSFVTRGALLTCRCLAYLAALLILARPELEIDAEATRPGPVPVVIDGSQSMEIRDAAGRARAEVAQGLVARLVALQERFPDLRLAPYWAGRTFVPLGQQSELVPDAEVTSVNRMVETALRQHAGSYCPGLVLISDGVHNSPEIVDQVLTKLRQERLPLYTVGVGEENPRDVAVPFVLAEDVVFRGEQARIYANVTHRGYAGREVVLNVSLNDTQVASQAVPLGEEADASVPLEYVPAETGEFDLRTEVAPADDEITRENNVFTKHVRVIDEKIRVLLVFGSPTWEYRYLRGALERDKRVQPRVLLESLDRRLLREFSTEYLARLPDSADALNGDFDLVVLSAVNVPGLPATFPKALAEFVGEHSGGLVLISDPQWVPYCLRGTPLEDLVPVTLGVTAPGTYREELAAQKAEPFSFEITEEGLTSPLLAFSGSRDENRQLWQSFPPLYECYRYGRLKPAALSLLATVQNRHRQSYPGIVQHAYGKGTVLFLGFDSTWRWRREHGDRYYREFWGKTVQFLGLPHLLHEAAQTAIYISRETCYVGQRVSITAKLSNPDFSPYLGDKVVLTVRQGDHAERLDLVPIPERVGMYRGNLWPGAAGELLLELPKEFYARPVKLRVLRQSRELVDSGLNRELLERAATRTGGRCYQAGALAPEALLADILERRHRVEIGVRRSAWDTWTMLLLALGLFSVEWLIRRLAYLD